MTSETSGKKLRKRARCVIVAAMSVRNSHFHRRKAVAPLKHPENESVDGRVVVFPPSKGGGPIEALICAMPCAVTSGRFPPSKGGGPIEALAVGRTKTAQCTISTVERRWPH